MDNDLKVQIAAKIEFPDDIMAEINALLDSIPVRSDIRKCFALNPIFLI